MLILLNPTYSPMFDYSTETYNTFIENGLVDLTKKSFGLCIHMQPPLLLLPARFTIFLFIGTKLK